MRREFDLPEEDLFFLDNLGLSWEAINLREKWVVIHDHPVFPGYNVPKAHRGLKIEPSYPETQIDMVYFLPELVRVDGKSINNLTPHSFDGNNWQRWSRHRTSKNPWRPGIDNIEMHLALVNNWLKREFERN